MSTPHLEPGEDVAADCVAEAGRGALPGPGGASADDRDDPADSGIEAIVVVYDKRELKGRSNGGCNGTGFK